MQPATPRTCWAQLWCPTVFDMAYEKLRSPALLLLTIVTYVLNVYVDSLLAKTPPCIVALAQLENLSAADIASFNNLVTAMNAFLFLNVLASLMASSGYHSWLWLPFACIVSVVYISLASVADARFCFSVAKYGSTLVGPTLESTDGAVSAGTVAAIRLLAWSLNLLALLLLLYLTGKHIATQGATLSLHTPTNALKEWLPGARRALIVAATQARQAAATAAASSQPKESGDGDDAGVSSGTEMTALVTSSVVMQNAEDVRGAPGIVISFLRLHREQYERKMCGTSHRTVWWWLITLQQAIPLRHQIAVTLSAIILFLAVLQLCVLSSDIVRLSSGWVDDISSAAVNDDVQSAVVSVVSELVMAVRALAIGMIVGAAITSVIIVGALVASCRFVLLDHMRIMQRFARAPEATEWSAGSTTTSLDEITPLRVLVQAGTTSEEVEQRAPAQVSGLDDGATTSIAGRFADGTLDLSAFAYGDSFYYIVAFLANVMYLASIFIAVITIIVFLLAYDRTATYMGSIIGTALGSTIVRLVLGACVNFCVVRKSRFYYPRFFMALDLLWTLSVSIVIAGTQSVVRTVYAVLVSLLRCTQLHEPVLPSRIALFDGGYTAYGAMMKTRYAPLLDAEGQPEESQV